MAKNRVIKTLTFLVAGAVAFFFLPQILWRSTPDLWLLKGPAKGASVSAVLLLIMTFLFLRSGGGRLSDVGIELDSRRCREFTVGLVAGVAMSAASALLLAFMFHFRWQLNRGAAPGAILTGVVLNSWSVLSEELLYRGYALRTAASVVGRPAAVFLLVSCFVASHWFAWGAWGSVERMLSVFCTVGLGGLLFSLAFLRTGSLALPLGLHLGFVWSNADIFTGMFARWYDDAHGLFFPADTTYYMKSSGNGWLAINIPYLAVTAAGIGLVCLLTRNRARNRTPAEASR